jgi:uncharacterized protein (DUF697 family)
LQPSSFKSNILEINNITALQATTAGGYSIYPNPVHNMLHVTNVQAGNIVQLYNNIGQLVLTQVCTQSQEASSLSAGLYQVRITSTQSSASHHILKE